MVSQEEIGAVGQTPCHKLKRKGRLVVLALVVLVAVTTGILLGVLLPKKEEKSDIKTSSSNSTVIRDGSYEVLRTVPHDPSAFTQGLELDPNNPTQYFKSTGLYGQSDIRLVDLETGQVLQQRDLADAFFGEGLTYFDGKLIQLTWREETAFVYNSTTLEVLERFSYVGEGWGICYAADRKIFFVSDGSSTLYTWDANTFEVLRETKVRIQQEQSADAEPLANLNELEWDIHSETILSNVWQEDFVVRIDPESGNVIASYDLSQLPRPAEGDVLNGIAITDTPNEVWVTGKWWDSLYLIRLSD